MHRRSGSAAIALLAALALAGCSATQSSVIDESVVDVGLDVAYTGVGPFAPEATAADTLVGAATLAGFSYADADGASIADPGFGAVAVVGDDPLTVRFTVADGLAWSDGVGIDGVDLLLDWAARAEPFAGASFGATPDAALAGVADVRLSADRKSVDVELSSAGQSWREAFRAPLPAHALAERAFGSSSPEAAKDDVIAAIAAAEDGDAAGLAKLARAWREAFAPGSDPLPASGPYRLAAVEADRVELVVNDAYTGPRAPTFERIELHELTTAADAVQALSIGALDLVQVAWSESLRGVLGSIGADRREIPEGDAPTTLVGWFHRLIDHVDPAADGRGALWNPWAWAPYSLVEG
ncbi:MAG: hypothetical protein BGO95_10830 [Micrococcales bacterium 73-13]|nr:MAG: hypothetical protein BGO95_10830 [Micrococcales bacterium 73-13]